MTEVYRAPMRSRDDAVPAHLAVERALEQGLCGMGGRLDPAPSSLDQALELAQSQHDERLARRLARFANVADGAMVWTLDADGLYWLGELAGPWHYDASAEARQVDLVHVRPCRWVGHPFEEPTVPDGVRATFARGGRNWQRTRSSSAEAASARLLDLDA